LAAARATQPQGTSLAFCPQGKGAQLDPNGSPPLRDRAGYLDPCWKSTALCFNQHICLLLGDLPCIVCVLVLRVQLAFLDQTGGSPHWLTGPMRAPAEGASGLEELEQNVTLLPAMMTREKWASLLSYLLEEQPEISQTCSSPGAHAASEFREDPERTPACGRPSWGP